MNAIKDRPRRQPVENHAESVQKFVFPYIDKSEILESFK